MLGYAILILIVSFVLGVAVNGAWLYASAAALAFIAAGAAAWLWGMATGRTGFFNWRF